MGSKEPTPENYTLLQGFEWNCPEDGKHYQRLTTALPQLKNIGISNIWLPPGCKASSTQVTSFVLLEGVYIRQLTTTTG